jgi:ATP-dependent helicase/nuclease subunit A
MSSFTKEQKLAISARGNVLVSAGAGTGKTRTVVERCLRLLIEEHCPLDRILMVTFTEAAAAEMRERIRKTLEQREREAGDEPQRTHLQEQLALLDTAQISTLHSFCLQLVRDHFHELHLDPQVNVLDDAQTVPLMHEALDALLDRCYSGQFAHADEIKRLIRQHGGSDERVRELVLKLHRYTQTLPPASRWIENELARLDHPEPQHWREWLVNGFIEWRDEWLPELQRYPDCQNLVRCFNAVRDLTRDSTREQIAAAMRCVPAAFDDDWQSPYTKTDYGNPLKSSFFADAKFLLSLTEQRDGRDPLKEDWEWLRGRTRALLALTREFTDEFTRAKRALGGVDFADLEQLALQLLVNANGTPTEIARACQERFEHVFVDECQDINAAQDAIIGAVTRTGNSANRFLVGDVKQSIYRFRLANPGIFRGYEEAWRQSESGQRIPLAENFRSREGVLEFVNPLFAALMRPQIGGIAYAGDATLRFGDSKKRSALSHSPTSPRVELHVIRKSSGEESIAEENGDDTNGGPAVEDVLAIEKEARLVADVLRKLRGTRHQVWDEEKQTTRDVEWRDMVVLLRSPKSRVETFAKEFSRAGIPLAASRAGFFSSIEVQDLVNLLRLLDNPLQDIPFAAVLRSPLVAMSANELAALRVGGRNGEEHPSFIATVNHCFYKRAATESAFTESARVKLKSFYRAFDRWRALVRQTTVAHCLETVLAETHYEALLLAQPRGRERVANVHRLLDLARRYDPFQRQGLYRFLRFITEQEDADLDEDAAVVAPGDAVRLMSIHKSKGLEFPVVVVACLAGQFNSQDLREDMLLSSEFGLCAKITPPHIDQRYPTLPWWLTKRREARELIGEEMRLLYVAMTRARDTLVLTAFDKTKESPLRWDEGTTDLTDRAVLKSQSYFAWLRRWLGTTTSINDWQDERHGCSAILRWQIYSEEEAAALGEAKQADSNVSSAEQIDVAALRQRLSWTYPFAAATTEFAKTNVTALRRRAAEDEDETQHIFVRRRARRAEGLSAAELGSAHHIFLQWVEFDRTGSEVELRSEAERLVNAGVLSRAQAVALDFDALLAFWCSPLGRKVVAEQQFAHREVPFTARFGADELLGWGLLRQELPGESVIVQGVVDLAVIKPHEITLVDFKTDRVNGDDLGQRVREYTPQLHLYAAALEKTYGVKVSQRWLHFLAAGETTPV